MLAFEMPLGQSHWIYDNAGARRVVSVQVEPQALDVLAGGTADGAYAVFAANRLKIELAARRIIDREGPNFVEPVRVTALDL